MLRRQIMDIHIIRAVGHSAPLVFGRRRAHPQEQSADAQQG
jgi:hypothetical protein